jgi:hypothetical protein
LTPGTASLQPSWATVVSDLRHVAQPTTTCWFA